MIKLVASGTTLRRNWSRENGLIWPQLVKRIKQTIDTDTEEWKAIVWFQGESDSYSNTTAFGYQADLTKFIANVRSEVYKVDSTTFKRPSDIPVVIVGLGCWVAKTTLHGSLVMKAQRRFVASTSKTAFVPTDDLSCDKHYDEASQLIIGARVANALKTLL
ncbi:carbohydrate esterase [Fragilaria crotonensis]|nr:carbohydrate esterase [Fragilaria crotonensis]